MLDTPARAIEPAPPEAAKAEIALHARELGFDAVGFAGPDQPHEIAAGLGGFIERGLHGEMDWLARTAERRAQPRALWSEVNTIIALGMNYGPPDEIIPSKP